MKTLLLLLPALCIYARTWQYFDLVSDDARVLEKPGDLPFWKQLWQELANSRLYDPARAHRLSTGLHIINTLLLYIALSPYGEDIAWWSAFLFSIHPLTQQAVGWVSGRPYAMGLLVALEMVIAANNNNWPLFVVVYILGYWVNVSTTFVPLALALALGKPWLAILVIPMLYFRYRQIAVSVCKCGWRGVTTALNCPSCRTPLPIRKFIKEGNNELRSIKPVKVILFLKTLGYWTRNAIYPTKSAMYHGYIYNYGLSAEDNRQVYSLDMNFVLGLVIVLQSFMLVLEMSSGIQALGMLFWLVNIAMFCNFVSFNQYISERYVYLPLFGVMICVVLATVGHEWIRFVLVGAYADFLYRSLLQWKGEYWNVEWNQIQEPDHQYVYLSRGLYAFLHGNLHGAAANYRESLAKKPKDNFKAHYNLIYALLLIGDIAGAKNHWQELRKAKFGDNEELREARVKESGDLIEWVEEQLKKSREVSIPQNKIKFLR